MPLDDSEWDLIKCLVLDHLVGVPDPYGELRLRFPDEAPTWPLTQVPAKNADTVVRFARAAPLTDVDPLSARLLQALLQIDAIAVRPDASQLRKWLDRLRKEQAALVGEDPFGALIFPGSGEVFIDRAPSRSLIASLVKPDPDQPEPVAMRVVGAEKSGKSYTYSFILHLSAPRGIVPVRLMMSRSSTAMDILRDLSVFVADPDERPDPVADPVKRLRHWAQWIVKQAVRFTPPCTWWFVFDQCNELDGHSDAVEFIAQLAVAIREIGGPRVQRPRLVLLGYGDQFADLQLPRKQVYLDQVEPVGDIELRDFFARVFREIDAKRPAAEAQDDAQLAEYIDVAVRQVLEDAEAAVANGIPYMTALGQSVEGAVDEYAES